MRLASVILALLIAAVPSLAHAGSYGCDVSYAYPTVYAPAYSYSYFPAGWWNSRYYPAGNYYWNGYVFYRQGYNGPYYGEEHGPDPVAPKYGPGWKEAALKYAEYRDDQVAYQRTLQALGINGQQYFSGVANTYGSYGGALSLGSYGNQGNTAYGYTYQQIQQAYGQTDLNALYQQSSRLVSGAQSLAADANQQFSGLVGQAGDNQANVARIFAEAAAREKIMNASKLQPSTTTTTTVQGNSLAATVGNVPAPVTMPRAVDGQPRGADTATDDEFMANVVKPLCFECHNGSQAKGKLDLSGYLNLTGEQKLKIWDRLALPITDRSHMPPADHPQPNNLQRWQFSQH